MLSENYEEKAILLAALEWHLTHGADEMLLDEPQDRTKVPKISEMVQPQTTAETNSSAMKPKEAMASKVLNFQDSAPQDDMMGAAEAIQEAQKLAATCETLEDLQNVITSFNGLSVKKTASNMVFADGNPKAKIMLIGEAPGADEDMQGKPFVGETGQLLDKILACINLDRKSDDLQSAVYISHILNWRPPGNRTPTSSEMNISLPFVEKHIALVNPDILIICGGVAGKMLLKSSATISKLRGSIHEYQGTSGRSIPAMVTYHPAYLLRTPAQKKAVWADMLMFQEKLKNL